MGVADTLFLFGYALPSSQSVALCDGEPALGLSRPVGCNCNYLGRSLKLSFVYIRKSLALR